MRMRTYIYIHIHMHATIKINGLESRVMLTSFSARRDLMHLMDTVGPRISGTRVDRLSPPPSRVCKLVTDDRACIDRSCAAGDQLA